MIAPDARVLVIAVARIGDTLLATPLLRALKAALPTGRLEVRAHPRRLDVLRHLPFIDRLSGLGKWAAWLGTARLGTLLPGRRFDWAFVLGHDVAVTRYALGGAARVVAFHQRDAALDARLALAVDEPAPPPHAVLHRLLLLQAAGIAAQDLRLAWNVTAEERAAADAWRSAHVPAAAAPVIGLQMASFHTKAQRDWPVQRFIELARLVLAEQPSAHFILLGDAGSLPGAQAFLAALPGRASIAAGALPLRHSAALMAGLDLYVGVDTGPTHIAGALGIPMVALYHASFPGRNLAPLQNPVCRVIEHPLTGQPDADQAHMADISAARVWTECAALLGQRQPT